MTEVSAGVDALLEQQPLWFTLTARSAATVEGTATVPGTPWAKSGISLHILDFPNARVRELVPGAAFPARCPERHVQYDQTFCLGLHHISVADPEGTRQWWEQLRQFIVFQSVAEMTGVWPPAHALDHGDAGEFHERALAIASELGIDEEYAAARLNEPSWITDPNVRLFGKKGEWINGRGPCPRGCRSRCLEKGTRKRPMLRCDCKHRAKLLELVQLERKRRAALAAYWDHVHAEGIACCGKMLACELREQTYKSSGK